jgi:hypothetical protein
MEKELAAVAIREPLEGHLVPGAECWKKGRLVDLSRGAGVTYHYAGS